MYLEKTGFTYDFNNQNEIYDHAHHGGGAEPFKGHTVKTKFIGANQNPVLEEIGQADHYENYFLGNDPSKWKSEIFPCSEVDYLNLYDGIDLALYQRNKTIKYDIIIHAGANPTEFKVAYSGQDELFINKKGELVITTPLGNITEAKPIAYQMLGGQKKFIECQYVLRGSEMHFELLEEFDATIDLIIDPYLSFSTFSGSTADNWGMTACPDLNKNLIAGGIVFGTGYPITTGAYSTSYGGGQIDIGISKFSDDGINLLFSTYIGGNGNETPHSLIVNQNNEIHILGATSSPNFPCTSTAFQNTFAGGPIQDYPPNLAPGSTPPLTFDGADIIIVKLNPTGTGVLGSTYYGGDDTDGLNSASNDIALNYGDGVRGEINVDNLNNIYIVSITKSDNIQTQNGFQSVLSGTQDAIIAKFNPDLSSLLWGTYFGGTDKESGNSLQLASNGDIVVCGGTTSNNLPNTAGQFKPTFQGGSTDGYIAVFSAPLYSAVKSTYLGTDDYDQAYFVQLDLDDFIYVFGQTRGTYPVSAGVYNNPNSGQFIHKLSANLAISQWSSTFGASSGNEELSPTAFLVSDCYQIYIAGWGGSVNSGNSNAINSSSNGMPITPGAFQTTTTGSNFYIAQFSADMVSIEYGTYMGSATSGDHVDGGSSRFDKDGSIYHAVCAACGFNGSFPTTPGVWSETNNSSNCNLAAFLFELGAIDASISTPTPVICIPDPVTFQNNSQNGNQFLWDFGDGTPTSTDFEPTHVYPNPGIYLVTLIVSDAAGCYSPDTATYNVEIQLSQGQAGTLIDTICPGNSVELWAIGGDTYSWGPPQFLNNATSSTPIATITEETTFTVDITSVCGFSQVSVTVYVYGANAGAGLDTAICVGGDHQLSATGGGTYLWSPTNTLDDPTLSNPLATPTITTYYYVDITTPEGCLIKDTTKVWVDQDIPYPNLIDSVGLCYGESIQIQAGGATSYLWSPNYNISATNVYNPFVSPLVDTSYAVAFTNACGTSYDTVNVDVIEVFGTISPDTTICPEGTAVLTATGGVSYAWWPTTNLSGYQNATAYSTTNNPTLYSVYITDEYGCVQTLTTFVDLYNTPTINVSPAVYAVVGDTTLISAYGNGTISWSPNFNISCLECTDALVWPDIEYIYTATITDANGCKNSAPIPIYYDPLIYVPNVFTPNGDHYNNVFKAEGLNIVSYQMLIFNRWGELVKTLNSIDQSWDGSYQGSLVKDDVYIWQIKYVDLKETSHILRGHVTVLK